MKTREASWKWMAAIAALASLMVLPSAAAAQTPAATPKAAALYSQQCAMCHGPDGTANTTVGRQLKAANLRSVAVQKLSDTQLKQVITKGNGKGMVAFGGRLSSQQIGQLVAYLRTLAANNTNASGGQTARNAQP